MLGNVLNWHGMLDIPLEGDEAFSLRFCLEEWSKDEELTINTFNREYSGRGFLFYDLQKALKSNDFQSWVDKYGVIVDGNFKNRIQDFNIALEHLCGNAIEKRIGIRCLNNIAKPPSMVYSNKKEAFVYQSNDILALMLIEIIDLLKFGESFTRCSCGLVYVKPKSQRKNYCPSCPMPSKAKNEANRKKNAEYIKNYRNRDKT